MGYAEGNIVGEQVDVGDRVVLNLSLGRVEAVGGDYCNIEEGDEFVITRVYNQSVLARSVKEFNVGYGRTGERSFSISRHYLRIADPNAPRPRRLGETPEQTGDVVPISIKDPGIQWLWDDMATFAEKEGYCNQYDALCAKIGIPGRPRSFTVTHSLGGLSFTTTVKARSQREANEQVEAILKAGLQSGTPTEEKEEQ